MDALMVFIHTLQAVVLFGALYLAGLQVRKWRRMVWDWISKKRGD